jgi:hypothetical protein
MMDDATRQRWWDLHLRVARGENLNSEEQVFYEAGLQDLHREEVLHTDLSGLREARLNLAALESTHAQLQAQREKLDAEITALEGLLSERTKQLSGIEE